MRRKHLFIAICVVAITLSGCGKESGKLVSLSPAVSNIICELGEADSLCAVSDYCPAPDGTTRCGTALSPDYDAISAIDPALVVSQLPLERGRLSADNLVLEPPTTIDGMKELYLRAAELVLSRAEAEKASGLFSARLDCAIGDNTGKKILFVLGDDLSVATGDTLAGDIVSKLGVNAADGNCDCSMPAAEIRVASPDFIFFSADVDISALDGSVRQLRAFRDGKYSVVDIRDVQLGGSGLVSLLEEMHRCLSFAG